MSQASGLMQGCSFVEKKTKQKQNQKKNKLTNSEQ